MTCEATIAAEAKKCKANEHLEGTTCVANTKQVSTLQMEQYQIIK